MASYLLTFSGTINGEAEQFSHTLALDRVGEPGPSEESIAEDAEGALRAMADGTFLAMYTDNTAWTEVRAAEITDLSLGTLRPAFRREVVPPVVGSNASDGMLPPQCAVVVTLVAGVRPNGQPLRGRFYLPAPRAGVLDEDGRLTTVAQEAFVEGARRLLQSLDQALEDQAPQVWSRILAVTQTVETARVGRVVDTIRSRRNALPEEYLDRTV